MHTHFRKFEKDKKILKEKKLIICQILPRNNPITILLYSFPIILSTHRHIYSVTHSFNKHLLSLRTKSQLVQGPQPTITFPLERQNNLTVKGKLGRRAWGERTCRDPQVPPVGQSSAHWTRPCETSRESQ